MTYILIFIGGAMFGCFCSVIAMSCCIVIGAEARREKRCTSEKQN